MWFALQLVGFTWWCYRDQALLHALMHAENGFASQRSRGNGDFLLCYIWRKGCVISSALCHNCYSDLALFLFFLSENKWKIITLKSPKLLMWFLTNIYSFPAVTRQTKSTPGETLLIPVHIPNLTFPGRWSNCLITLSFHRLTLWQETDLERSDLLTLAIPGWVSLR